MITNQQVHWCATPIINICKKMEITTPNYEICNIPGTAPAAAIGIVGCGGAWSNPLTRLLFKTTDVSKY
jgi:hypothetical protein